MNATAARLCERYGPGRLPGAEARAVGAGYAMATAALSAATLFVLVTGGFALLAGGPGPQGSTSDFLVFYGLWAVPIVVPAAFLAGAIVWRTLPEKTPYYGPVAGLLATALTYVVATGLLAVLVIGVTPVLYGDPLDVTGYGPFAGFIGAIGFIYTFWLTLPLGTVSGDIHDQAREVAGERPYGAR